MNDQYELKGDIKSKKLSTRVVDAYSIAFLLIMVSVSMLFGTLFLGYFVYRFSAINWSTGFEKFQHSFYPVLSTILLISSEICLLSLSKKLKNVFTKGFRADRSTWVLFYVFFFLGLSFLISQFLYWNYISALGFFNKKDILTSLIYAFTIIHGAHIIFSLSSFLFPIFWLLRFKEFLGSEGIGKIQREESEANQIKSKNRFFLFSKLSNFWHFMGVIWYFLFVALFIY
jgi:cytochrome c oxidase subunit 3